MDPRTANDAEITAAYKRLARLYHPDKHHDAVKRAQAELLFSKLKNAHEVLSDPHKRAIYDCLGAAGLQEQGWEVVQRTRTPQEIRAEYESLARLREERRLQQRTNPSSKLSMTVNATDLFDRYLYSSGSISPRLKCDTLICQSMTT
jgi:DnaJ family protein C protein 11